MHGVSANQGQVTLVNPSAATHLSAGSTTGRREGWHVRLHPGAGRLRVSLRNPRVSPPRLLYSSRKGRIKPRR